MSIFLFALRCFYKTYHTLDIHQKINIRSNIYGLRFNFGPVINGKLILFI